MAKLPGKPFERKLIQGYLHEPVEQAVSPAGADAIAITHGAGGDCESPLLVALADAFAAAGMRCDTICRFESNGRAPRLHKR
jgi:predicted alpha/beta-hydrolase family hydrolase